MFHDSPLQYCRYGSSSALATWSPPSLMQWGGERWQAPTFQGHYHNYSCITTSIHNSLLSVIDGNILPGAAACYGIRPRAGTAERGTDRWNGAEELNFIGAAANQCEQSLNSHDTWMQRCQHGHDGVLAEAQQQQPSGAESSAAHFLTRKQYLNKCIALRSELLFEESDREIYNSTCTLFLLIWTLKRKRRKKGSLRLKCLFWEQPGRESSIIGPTASPN